MKTLAVGIYFEDEKGEITSKRIIGSSWNSKLEYELKHHHAINVDDEIASILCKHLVTQLSPATIKDMLGEIKENERKQS